MAIDYFLACDRCKEFIDLHKWPIVEQAGKYLVDAHYPLDKYPGQACPEGSPYAIRERMPQCLELALTSQDIVIAIKNETDELDYIRELIPIVARFAENHAGHELLLFCDRAELPWCDIATGFDDWLMLPGVFDFYAYLPRNLLELDRLHDWSDVIKHKRDCYPFKYGEDAQLMPLIAAIREAFIKRVSLQKE